MKIRITLLSLFVFATMILSFGATAQADTIKLRDGSVLKGKVVSYNQRRFTIIVYIGGSTSQHVIPVEDIESVEFDATDTTVASATGRIGDPALAANTAQPATPTDNRPLDQTNSAATGAPATGNPQVNPENDADMIATIAEKTVSVAAGADWTSSEIRVQRGQRIVISAIGEVDLGDGKRTGPEGLQSSDRDKLMPEHPTGALIAVIGDDNNDFVFVGQSTEFVAKHNGILFLSINEGNLKDNNGAFVARVKVLSNR